MKKIVAALVLTVTATATADFRVPREHTDSQCLASAIHYEARGESLDGQRAVYEVIRNRARVTRQSICEVVKAPRQFSWYPWKPIKPLTDDMRELLNRVKGHRRILENENFRWFFSGRFIPRWALRMECRIIGNHKFCKEQEDGRKAVQRH